MNQQEARQQAFNKAMQRRASGTWPGSRLFVVQLPSGDFAGTHGDPDYAEINLMYTLKVVDYTIIEHASFTPYLPFEAIKWECYPASNEIVSGLKDAGFNDNLIEILDPPNS